MKQRFTCPVPGAWILDATGIAPCINAPLIEVLVSCLMEGSTLMVYSDHSCIERRHHTAEKEDNRHGA
ncbi:hypothetical protein [Dictyobacter alpinus]|uniref:hypothetical protein n=1 Tax=Dictyobacter alpinus TaxID=2014873 RepID=UPI000F8317DA|nr:hypothetical protein [Dictyobacter alpinus]